MKETEVYTSQWFCLHWLKATCFSPSVAVSNDEEDLGCAGRRLNSKMVVYSGSKSAYLPKMMSLYDQCIRVLQNNIDCEFSHSLIICFNNILIKHFSIVFSPYGVSLKLHNKSHHHSWLCVKKSGDSDRTLNCHVQITVKDVMMFQAGQSVYHINHLKIYQLYWYFLYIYIFF